MGLEDRLKWTRGLVGRDLLQTAHIIKCENTIEYYGGLVCCSIFRMVVAAVIVE